MVALTGYIAVTSSITILLGTGLYMEGVNSCDTSSRLAAYGIALLAFGQGSSTLMKTDFAQENTVLVLSALMTMLLGTVIWGIYELANACAHGLLYYTLAIATSILFPILSIVLVALAIGAAREFAPPPPRPRVSILSRKMAPVDTRPIHVPPMTTAVSSTPNPAAPVPDAPPGPVRVQPPQEGEVSLDLSC